MKIGIYKITSPSNKVYVGQSISLETTWDNRYMNLKCKGQPKLYNSFLKYGAINHQFEILEECSLEQLNERETYYKQIELDKVGGDWKKVLFCDLYDNGVGPRSEETKKKMSESGKKRITELKIKRKDKSLYENNELRCKKIGEANKGKKHSEESKLQKSKKLLGNTNKKGSKLTPEQCERISKSKIGHKMFNNEWKEKISKSMKGKPLSEEHKLNLKGPKHSEEFKNRIGKINSIARCIPVLQKDTFGNIIKEWKSGKEASKILGIQKSNINNACKGRLKTYKGFVWEQKNK